MQVIVQSEPQAQISPRRGIMVLTQKLIAGNSIRQKK